MISDDDLLRDTRSAEDLARALLAPTLRRYVKVRLGIRVSTKAQALAAITEAQAAERDAR